MKIKKVDMQNYKAFHGLNEFNAEEGVLSNRRLAQWRVTLRQAQYIAWLTEHSTTSHQHLWCIDLVLLDEILRNPPLRQVPKREINLNTKNHRLLFKNADIHF